MTKMTRRYGLCAVIIIALILIVDQILKIWVKTHFYLGEDYRITQWFHLVFVENNGMAFGMQIIGKLFLSIVRIVAVSFLIWYLIKVCKSKPGIYPPGYVVCLALITAGASGNIFDSLFYGLIFNDPAPPMVAELFPPDGGYAPVFYGKVVDMFYFPLFSFDWPQWIPVVGGQQFLFFQPVFNLADAAISVGIIVLILFYSKYLYFGTNTPKETSDSEK